MAATEEVVLLVPDEILERESKINHILKKQGSALSSTGFSGFLSKCGIIILVFVGFLLVHSVYQYKYSGYNDHILIKTNLVKENNYSQREYVLYNNYYNDVTFIYFDFCSRMLPIIIMLQLR